MKGSITGAATRTVGIRQKRSDTLVETLRDEYGPDFASGFRSDAKLGTVREATGKSLSEMVHGNKKES
jgi:hypothetical protein